MRARTLRNQTQILLSDNPPVSAVPALRKSRHFSKVSPAFLGILKFQLGGPSTALAKHLYSDLKNQKILLNYITLYATESTKNLCFRPYQCSDVAGFPATDSPPPHPKTFSWDELLPEEGF